jgi:hypothetical protein
MAGPVAHLHRSSSGLNRGETSYRQKTAGAAAPPAAHGFPQIAITAIRGHGISIALPHALFRSSEVFSGAGDGEAIIGMAPEGYHLSATVVLGLKSVAEDFYKTFFRDVEIGAFDVDALRFSYTTCSVTPRRRAGGEQGWRRSMHFQSSSFRRRCRGDWGF